jgi:uracil-DNA glycosylase
MKVLFVAQNPKLPWNVKHPFEGTKSGKMFDRWLEFFGRPEYRLVNATKRFGKVSWKDYDRDGVGQALRGCTHVVALGKYAAGLLDRLGVKYFELPHPSGLSRKLNDKKALAEQLFLCELYLHGSERL